MKRIASVGAGLLIAATVLTGCAAPAPVEPAPAASQSAAAASPRPEPQELPAFNVGDIVEPGIAEALNDVRGDVWGYEMPDGTYTLVNANEPFPAAVQDALDSQIASNYDPDNSFGSFKKSTALGYQAAGKTGKSVLVVGQLITSNDAGQNYPIWAVGGYTDRDLTTRDEALAYAQEIISSQPDPQRWAIIG